MQKYDLECTPLGSAYRECDLCSLHYRGSMTTNILGDVLRSVGIGAIAAAVKVQTAEMCRMRAQDMVDRAAESGQIDEGYRAKLTGECNNCRRDGAIKRVIGNENRETLFKREGA